MSEDPVLKAIAKRRAQKQGQNDKQSNPSEKKKKGSNETKEELMINPDTKRPMKVGGRAHKAYLKKLNGQLPQETRKSSPPRKKKRKTMEDEAQEEGSSNEAEEVTEKELMQLMDFARTILPSHTVDKLFN